MQTTVAIARVNAIKGSVGQTIVQPLPCVWLNNHDWRECRYGSQNPYKSQFVSGFEISAAGKRDVLAFVRNLTDETFIHNPTLSDPTQY
ncbi:MAG: hypothetical protein WCD18_21285 [Thermosynechococcaceae cyanobacterium]